MDIGFSVCNTQLQCIVFLALLISANYPFIPAFLLSTLLSFSLILPFLKRKKEKLSFGLILRIIFYLGLALTILGYLLIYINSFKYEKEKALKIQLKNDYDKILATDFNIRDSFYSDGTFKVKLYVPYSAKYIVDLEVIQNDKIIAFKAEKDIYINRGEFTVDSGTLEVRPNIYEPIELVLEIGTNDLPEIIYPGKEHIYYHTGVMFYSSYALIKGKNPCFSRIRDYMCVKDDKLHLSPLRS